MNYAYQKPNGEVVWHSQPLSEAPPPPALMLDAELGVAVRAKRSFRAEIKGGHPTKGWPLTCFASGVNAEQAQDLRDAFKKAGVPTEVTPDGDPVYRDAGHRRRALKARGFFDRAAYY